MPKKLTDEELVIMIRNNDSVAFIILYKRYKGLAKYIVKEYAEQFPFAWRFFDELIDIAIDNFMLAIKNYIDGNNSFLSYWWIICRRDFSDHIRQRKNSQYEVVDIDTYQSLLSDSMDEERTLTDIELSFVKELVYTNKELFTDKELILFEYTLKKYEVEDIALENGWTRSQTYRIRKTLIKKISKLFKV